MATIGQSLTAPESGWKRIDNTDSNLNYEGTWSVWNNSNAYNSTMNYVSANNGKLKFNFIGTKVRLIVAYSSATSVARITINGISENVDMKLVGTTNLFQIIGFEKLNLPYGFHSVIVESVTSTVTIDAIDIDDTGVIRNPYKRLSIQHPTTSKSYSLADKTLIHLPSPSDKNMILHGIESGKEIKLDEDFDKMKYAQDTSEVLGEGKTFTHAVDMSNTKVNKIIL